MLLLEAQFDDVDELCQAVRHWDLDFRPLRLKGMPGPVGSVRQQAIADVVLSHARFGVSIDQWGSPPRGLVTFVVLAEPMHRLWWRGHDVGSGAVLVFPVGSELRSLSGPDFEICTLSVSEQRILDACERFQIAVLPPHRRAQVFYPDVAVLAEWRRVLRDLVWTDNGPDSRSLFELCDHMILAWLGGHRASRGQIPRLRARDRAVRGFLDTLDGPDWMKLHAAQLCAQGGVCERTLQYAFRERFGLTPAAFLKARRLSAARRRLQQAVLREVKVGDIAAEYGFDHQAQFAVDYRRAFGEPPLETLKG